MSHDDWHRLGGLLLGPEGRAVYLKYQHDVLRRVVGPSVWPVFATKSDGQHAVVGTFFGLATKSAYLLVSAAHVLADAAPHGMMFGLPTRDRIRGELVKTSDQPARTSTDRFDIAVMRLHPATHAALEEQYFVRLEDVDIEPNLQDVGARGDDPGLMYAFVGYPGSKNKVFSPKRVKAPHAVINQAFPTFPDRYYSVGASPLTHVVLKFGHAGAVNEKGQLATPPKLNGISGGSVWRADWSTAAPPRLVAMAIEFNTEFRLVICVRMWVIFQFIRACFADIAEELPSLKSVAEPVLFPVRSGAA